MLPVFLEVVIAPAFEPDALNVFAEKKNLRLLALPNVADANAAPEWRLKQICGGLLVQEADRSVYEASALKTVTIRQPEGDAWPDLEFAMKVVKHVKSNAIVLVKDRQTVGIGPGQPNRVTSARIAIERAGDKARGSVLGSDAFFPFDDTVRAAIDAGVTAIIQPGGSIRDQDSIDVCNEAGIPMVFTGMRHFLH